MYGALVEWYWHGIAEVLGEQPAPLPLDPPQIQDGPTGGLILISPVNDRRISCFPSLPAKISDIVPSNASGSSHFYLFNQPNTYNCSVHLLKRYINYETQKKMYVTSSTCVSKQLNNILKKNISPVCIRWRLLFL